MRSLFLLLVYCQFFLFGLRAPFILVLGYVWVDIFTPQLISYGLLTQIPVSLLLAAAIAIAFVFLPRSPDVRPRLISVLVALFAGWMTLSLAWAVVPEFAVAKWSWAIKSVAFSCVIPFFFRNRVQIESLIWIIVLSGMGHCAPFAAKVLLSGGGYGRALGLVEVNTGYGESSTLAMFAVSLVPMCLYLREHSVLFKRGLIFKTMMLGFAACAILTSLGTYARTGLVASGVLGIALFLTSKRKLMVAGLAAVFILGAGAFMGDVWSERMSTITDPGDDTSAMGRVGVWLWTLDYVAKHPLGGSFDVYRINQINLELDAGNNLEATGKAFHSVYFEILGELGMPGFALYMIIVAVTFYTLWSVRRSCRTPDQLWLRSLCDTLGISTLIFLTGGAFIGVGFNSYFYYLGAAAASLLNIRARLIREQAADAGRAQPPGLVPGPMPGSR